VRVGWGCIGGGLWGAGVKSTGRSDGGGVQMLGVKVRELAWFLCCL